MKIEVDDKGWALAAEAAEPPAKPGSGVFQKVTKETVDELSNAATEPSPPSDEANDSGAQRLPGPPLVPREMIAEDDDGAKVA